jgi:hypothetical protein
MLKSKSRKPAPKTSKTSPPSSPRPAKEETAFLLDDWYASDDAKRKFGSICQQVNEQGREIELLGSEERPLLTLVDAESVEQGENEIEISIDEAKADWSAVTAAALFYGTVFRIRGKNIIRAVLRRHKVNRHSAIHRYRRPQPEDLLQTVEHLIEELRGVCKHFDSTTNIIDRRFKEVWREKNGLPPQ